MGIFDRGIGKRHVNQLTIPSSAHGFEMFYMFSMSEPFKHLKHFIDIFGRNQHRYRLAEHFVLAVAEYLFGASIPTGEYSIKALADDRIIGRLNHDRQP